MVLLYEVAVREPVPDGMSEIEMANRIAFEIGQMQTKIAALSHAFRRPLDELHAATQRALKHSESYAHLTRRVQVLKDKHRQHVASLEAQIARLKATPSESASRPASSS